MEKKLVIIDSLAVIHRAYHALPPLTTKDGSQINALYGFLLLLAKVIKELKPSFLVAVFDLPGPTMRHEMYKLYKATRKETPESLTSQIPLVKGALEALGITVLTSKGHEADDVIATVCERARNDDVIQEIFVVTGDMDLLQLVSAKVKVYALRRGVKDTLIYDEQGVREKYGVGPEQIADFKALRGDVSDNIPGVLGIGDKTASALIQDFGSVEELYSHLELKSAKSESLKDSLREKLTAGKKEALLSKKLVLLIRNISLDFGPADFIWNGARAKETSHFLERYGFKSLAARFIQEGAQGSPDKIKNNLKLW